MPRTDSLRAQRLAAERRLYEPAADGPLSVCLVYPNTYPVAMGNLGFQSVFRQLACDPRVTADRAYLPDGPSESWPRLLRSFERERPLADFDVVAFSLSFETDYVHVLQCLALAGVTLRRTARGPDEPLVMAGGPATFLNPEPLAEFVDLFLLGEAEEMLSEFVDRAARSPRDRASLLAAADDVGGAYRPDRYTPVYEPGGPLRRVEYDGPGDGRVVRRYLAALDGAPTRSQIVTPEAVFGDMYLVEASRGCEWGCRFCAAGFMYRPVRYRSPAVVAAGIDEGLAVRDTIGLVGAEMASQPGIAALCERVVAGGGRPSPSSLKADVVTRRLARALGAGGTRSVTVAPEAGSERLRRVINKNLTDAEILRAAEWLVGGGVDALKLYVMVGLPTETDEDVDAIVALVERVRARLADGGRRRVGRIQVSINGFVPKPWTPFQWEPMEPLPQLRAKLARVRRVLGALPAVQVDTESPREAYLQTVLSRGDRRVAPLLERLAGAPGEWWAVLRALRGGGDSGVPDPDFWVHRRYDVDETLPWDFIDHAVDKRYLAAERRKAFAAVQTPPCDTHTCHACGAC
ncbi:MAG TPA: radical SAM protein [Candidatus Limnocylindria bacterium]|nr:radical SAM protein [Candidatus Limnocylindria bacterium]